MAKPVDSAGFVFYMETKTCTKCKEQKPLSMFSKHIRRSDGLRSTCKTCEAAYRRENRAQRNAYNAEYWKRHPEKYKDVTKQRREKNREKLAENQRKYYAKVGYKYSDRKEYGRQYYLKNKDKINQRKTAIRNANKEKYNEYAKNSRVKNREARLIREKERRQDPLFKIISKIRTSINKGIRRGGFGKSGKTELILGCSYDFFIQYIEAQFIPGMDWGNATLDHIRPLKYALTEEDVIALNHYTNFQPLFHSDNSKKKAKLIEKQLRLL